MAFKNPFHLLPGSITSVYLAASAVTSGAIAAGAVLTAALADAAVTTVKITDNAITAGKIQADAVTATAIQANAIIASKIAAGAVTATAIAAGSIDTTKLTATAINGMTITGSVFQTAATGARWVIDSVTNGIALTAYSGKSNENSPAFIEIDNSRGGGSSVVISSAEMANGAPFGGTPGAAQVEITSVGIGVSPGGYSAVNVTAGVVSNGKGGMSLNGSKAVRSWGSGSFSDTTDANGQLGPFNHSCGEVPNVVIVNQSGGPGTGRLRAVSLTSTTFKVQVNNTTTGNAFAAGTVFAGQFFAWAGV